MLFTCTVWVAGNDADSLHTQVRCTHMRYVGGHHCDSEIQTQLSKSLNWLHRRDKEKQQWESRLWNVMIYYIYVYKTIIVYCTAAQPWTHTRREHLSASTAYIHICLGYFDLASPLNPHTPPLGQHTSESYQTPELVRRSGPAIQGLQNKN